MSYFLDSSAEQVIPASPKMVNRSAVLTGMLDKIKAFWSKIAPFVTLGIGVYVGTNIAKKAHKAIGGKPEA